MVSFLALYRGASLSSAELVAVSTAPDLITHVAATLLSDPKKKESETPDKAILALDSGRRRALRVVYKEARQCTGREE